VYPLWLRNVVLEDLFKNTSDILNKSYKFLISKDNWKNLSETESVTEYIRSYINDEKPQYEKAKGLN